jgi:predicted RNase H-like nuclease
VNMPIGLPECVALPCDRKARRLLGHPRGTSVFPEPTRPMLAASCRRAWSARPIPS